MGGTNRAGPEGIAGWLFDRWKTAGVVTTLRKVYLAFESAIFC